MNTCRRCGTPNRPGRNHCIACSEPLEVLGEAEQAVAPEPNVPAPAAPATPDPSPQDPAPQDPRPASPAVALPPGGTLLGLPQRGHAGAPAASAAPAPPVAVTVPSLVAAPPVDAPAAAPSAAGPVEAPVDELRPPDEAPAPDVSPPSTAPTALSAVTPAHPVSGVPASGVPATDPPVTDPPAQAPAKLDPTLPPDSGAGAARRSRRGLWATVAALIGLGGLAAVALLVRPWSALPWSAPRSAPVAVTTQILLDQIAETPPVASLVLFTPPGSRATVDGAPIAPETPSTEGEQERLVVPIDLTDTARGENPLVEHLERSLPVVVTLRDGTVHRSTAVVRAPITPLRLLGPGPRWVLEPRNLVVSGITSPGALVVAASSRVRADDAGRFVLPVRAASGTLLISASAPEHVSRAVPVEVHAKASLPAATSFSALAAKPTERVRLDGRVLTVRGQPEGTAFTIEVPLGCPSAPCRVSALYPVQATGTSAQGGWRAGQEVTLVGDVVSADAVPHLRAEHIASR